MTWMTEWMTLPTMTPEDDIEAFLKSFEGAILVAG